MIRKSDPSSDPENPSEDIGFSIWMSSLRSLSRRPAPLSPSVVLHRSSLRLRGLGVQTPEEEHEHRS